MGKRERSKTFQLRFAALIGLTQRGWENIFRIQYAQSENKRINIGIFPYRALCSVWGRKKIMEMFLQRQTEYETPMSKCSKNYEGLYEESSAMLLRDIKENN